MTSLEITCSLFSPRCHRPTTLQHLSRPSSWPFFSTSRLTGRIRPGALSSALFSGWPSQLNAGYILSSTEAVPQFLHSIQHLHPISRHRTAPLLFLSIHSQPGPGTTDGQVISGCHLQHADFPRPARSPGSLLNANPQEGAGGNPAGMDATGSAAPHTPPNHC